MSRNLEQPSQVADHTPSADTTMKGAGGALDVDPPQDATLYRIATLAAVDPQSALPDCRGLMADDCRQEAK